MPPSINEIRVDANLRIAVIIEHSKFHSKVGGMLWSMKWHGKSLTVYKQKFFHVSNQTMNTLLRWSSSS